MTWLKEWLKDLPTTALVTVVFSFLAVYSGIMYWIAVWREWTLDESTFAIFLGFVAAGCGISFLWFGKKRDTFIPTPPTGKDQEDTPSKSVGAALPAAPMEQGEQ